MKQKFLKIAATLVVVVAGAAYLPVIAPIFETAVTAEAASTYSVDYSYDSKKYSVSSVSGDYSVPLNDIISALGLSGTVSNVESFDTEYISVYNENAQWTVTTHNAFGAGALYVTIDDTKYTLKVTSLPDSISVVLYSYIYFDANGGSGTMTTVDKWNTSHTDSALIKEGANYTLPECSYTAPEGYKFSYWEINGLKYLPGEDFFYVHPTKKVVVKAVWEEKIASTYKELDNSPHWGKLGYCVDSKNNKTYIIYGFTPETGKQVSNYDYIAFYSKSNDGKIAPDPNEQLPEYIDTNGQINTVYKAVKFNNDDSDVLSNTAVGEDYIVAIVIDGTDIPDTSKFYANAKESTSPGGSEQGNDINDD